MVASMLTSQIIEGDCVATLKGISAGTVDLTVFSPPYDSVRTYNGFDFDLKGLGDELHRVTADGGVVACVIQDGTKDFAKSMTSFRLAVDWVDRVGFRLFETVIYSRHGRPGGWWNQRFRVDHEYIHLFLKGDRPKSFDKSSLEVASKYAGTEWHGTDRTTDGDLVPVQKERFVKATKCRGTIWSYAGSCTESNRLKLKHPATYPDALAIDLIRCFSAPNDLVLDPTCGSGTTCVAAANLGRRYIGVELSAEYAEIARARLAAEVRDYIL